MQKVKTIQVKGKAFDLTLTSEGEFQTNYKDEAVKAESVKRLVSLLANRISREQRVNIRIAYWEKDSWNDKPGRLRMGAIIGIHGGNGNLLVKWDGVKGSEQFGGNTNAFIDPKQAKELERLGETLDKAQKALDDFKKKHSFNAWECVRALLKETDAG
jgi:hypothetical protein